MNAPPALPARDPGGEWCDVMEMLKATCVHCRPPAERRRLDATFDAMRGQMPGAPRRDVAAHAEWSTAPAPARYSGHCRACGESWQPGDMIVRHGAEWGHADCRD